MRAVILAGGKGTRLAPYTAVLPKPLVPLGDMPILEILIRRLRHYGICDMTLAVGHLAQLIMAYFADGARYGVNITYVREEQPLGTAGPLSLVPGLDDTFLLMNGDLLTSLDCRDLIDFHRRSGASVTVATCRRSVNIDLGVLVVDSDGLVRDYIEKPVQQHDVSMGIYAFEPRVLDHIKPACRLDLPDLILRLLGRGEKVCAYRFDGYWLDVGRPEDYSRAIEEFDRMRGQLLPELTASSNTLGFRPEDNKCLPGD